MQKFLKKIALFLTPLILGLIVIYMSPVDKKDAYCYIKGSCYNRGEWMYHRMFEDSTDIDIAFLGTSHTMCGVQDSMLNSNEDHVNVANLAFCWQGLNFQYVILQDLLANKKPSMIVFEVREQEENLNHTLFPYIASDKDLFEQPFMRNEKCLSNLYHAGRMRFDLKIEEPRALHPAYGKFGFSARGETADYAALHDWQHQMEEKYGIGGEYHDAVMTVYIQHYFERMLALCKENGVEVKFLYLPDFGFVLDEPLNTDVYRACGELLIPPRSLFENPYYWADEGHLNTIGATQLTNWLKFELLH